jgi:hypothetical protein
MKLTIQTTDKAEHAVELGGAAPTVGELRAEVKQTLGAPDCTMVHRGTVLADDAQSLAATGVEDGGKIVVIIKKPKTVQPPLCAPRLHARMRRVDPVPALFLGGSGPERTGCRCRPHMSVPCNRQHRPAQQLLPLRRPPRRHPRLRLLQPRRHPQQPLQAPGRQPRSSSR